MTTVNRSKCLKYGLSQSMIVNGFIAICIKALVISGIKGTHQMQLLVFDLGSKSVLLCVRHSLHADHCSSSCLFIGVAIAEK